MDVTPDMMIAFLVALTRQCGSYGGFCMGSVMAMFYDASVGYALAINLVGYTFIGWLAPILRVRVFGRLFQKLKIRFVVQRRIASRIPSDPYICTFAY